MINVTSVENMKKSDAKTTESIPAVELMARAAKGILDAMKAECFRAPVAVVCGVGNNAGDGFALAELLSDAGVDCTVFLLSDRFSESGRYYFDRCEKKGVKVSETLDLAGFGTVVDCIFGVGLRGERVERFLQERKVAQLVRERGGGVPGGFAQRVGRGAAEMQLVERREKLHHPLRRAGAAAVDGERAAHLLERERELEKAAGLIHVDAPAPTAANGYAVGKARKREHLGI